jgi:hypothetical protein
LNFAIQKVWKKTIIFTHFSWGNSFNSYSSFLDNKLNYFSPKEIQKDFVPFSASDFIYDDNLYLKNFKYIVLNKRDHKLVLIECASYLRGERTRELINSRLNRLFFIYKNDRVTISKITSDFINKPLNIPLFSNTDLYYIITKSLVLKRLSLFIIFLIYIK